MDCFTILWRYYILQLIGGVIGDIIFEFFDKLDNKKFQYINSEKSIGDEIFSRVTYFIAIFVVLMDIGICSIPDAEIIAHPLLLANYLLIVSHLSFAFVLLRARIGGPRVGFSLIGGILFMIGVISSGGLWPHPGKDWLFWGVLGGWVISYLGLRLLLRRHFLKRERHHERVD